MILFIHPALWYRFAEALEDLLSRGGGPETESGSWQRFLIWSYGRATPEERLYWLVAWILVVLTVAGFFGLFFFSSWMRSGH